MDLKDLSSNWKKLQAMLERNGEKGSQMKKEENGQKRKQNNDTLTSLNHPKRRQLSSRKAELPNRMQNGTKRRPMPGDTPSVSRQEQPSAGLSPTTELGKYVAIDCEMVGVGPNPVKESALARVSIVNFNGEQVYDSYVRPKETVTDWRTHVSGILPKHMVAARSLEEVQVDITKILKDRVLVGHAIRNDLDALLLSHPKRDIRDTAKHAAYRKLAGGGSPRLKVLAEELLGMNIQTGEHSSVEDARACMMLFRRDKDAFEREHAKKWPSKVVVVQDEDGGQKKKAKKKKKKKKR